MTAPPLSEYQWRLLLAMSRSLAVTTDIEALLKKIAEATVELLDCERASVFLHDPISKELWTPVALQSKVIRIPETAGIAGAAFTTNQVVLVPDAQQDPRFNREVDKRSGYTTHSILSAPMSDIDGRPVGVIQALNRRHGTFTDADSPWIQLLADHAGVAVQRHRLQLQAVDAASLRREMELARGLQQSLLPQNPPQIPGIESAAWAATASLTGGDAYDLWPCPDGSLALLLADAAGHGLAPAFVVAQVRTLVRAFSEEFPALHPEEILGHVNRRIAQDFGVKTFITTFLARLAPDGTLLWSSAGHGPVFLRTAGDQSFKELDPPHLPLGVDAQWDAAAPPPVQLSPGGMLVAPSDGMFEAFDRAGEEFGIARLLSVITAHSNKPVDAVVDQVRLAVQTWTDNQPATDDQTLVVVRRT